MWCGGRGPSALVSEIHPKVQVSSPILQETPEEGVWLGGAGRGDRGRLQKHGSGAGTININFY